MAARKFTTDEARAIGDQLRIDWSPIDLEQFRMGLEVGLEHGRRDPETDVTHDDPIVTGKIALAHLREIPVSATNLREDWPRPADLSDPSRLDRMFRPIAVVPSVHLIRMILPGGHEVPRLCHNASFRQPARSADAWLGELTMKRVALISTAVVISALVVSVADANSRRKATVTETAQAFFFGPGPASAGLGAFDADLRLTATVAMSRGPGGTQSESSWFDRFTIFDRATRAPLLSCSASGPLPANGFTVSDDLQLAALDASAASMKPEGGSAGFNDAVICPTIALRVLTTWHAARPAEFDGPSDNCEPGHRGMFVDASANAVTINWPASTNPTVIQQGTSVAASISRDVNSADAC